MSYDIYSRFSATSSERAPDPFSLSDPCFHPLKECQGRSVIIAVGTYCIQPDCATCCATECTNCAFVRKS